MSKHTPAPWVQFADQGKCVAILPAGRDGDVCTFDQSPSDADARLIAAAPNLLAAIEIAIVFDDRRRALSEGKPPTKGQWETFIKAARTAMERAHA